MWSNDTLANESSCRTNNRSIGRETVRRILLRKGICSYVAIRKSLLTIKDRIQRLKWCRQRQCWTVENWATVKFSDESNFEVFNRNSRVWVKD